MVYPNMCNHSGLTHGSTQGAHPYHVSAHRGTGVCPQTYARTRRDSNVGQCAAKMQVDKLCSRRETVNPRAGGSAAHGKRVRPAQLAQTRTCGLVMKQWDN